MSTRIYKGFRLATDSLSEALRIVEAFRPWVTAQSEALLATFLANIALEDTRSRVEAYDAWHDLRNLMRKGHRVPHVDTDFTVILIPAAGSMLGIIYTEHQAWYEAWCKRDGVEEYAYWNSSDAPDGMSEAQWDARRNAWSILTNQPVAMQGFAIELVSPNGPIS